MMKKIAVVAPARRLEAETERQLAAILQKPEWSTCADVTIHPQCRLSYGHFAGTDDERLAAFLEVANDPSVDAVWFARGGYGSGRLLNGLPVQFSNEALDKTYLGYSDCGFLLSALTAAGAQKCFHGPMPGDLARDGGQIAIERSLAFLCRADKSALEPSLETDTAPTYAFNLSILAGLIGTPWLPEATGAVLHLEEVGEYDYTSDRRLMQIANSDWFRSLAGVRPGRFSAIIENDIEFPHTYQKVVAHWCTVAGVPLLGASDIGHDVDNKIVPFGDARL